MVAKKQWYHDQCMISQNLVIKILWYLAEFLLLLYLNNENFKIEVEQTNFVTHLIITVQLYYYLKTCLLKFGQISYLTEQKWNFKVVFNTSCCHGNYENVKFYLSIKIFHQYIFTCQVSACELQLFSCHDLTNDIYLQTAKTVFSSLKGVNTVTWRDATFL